MLIELIGCQGFIYSVRPNSTLIPVTNVKSLLEHVADNAFLGQFQEEESAHISSTVEVPLVLRTNGHQDCAVLCEG